MKRHFATLITFICCLLSFHTLQAQELQCDVRVSSAKIPGSDKTIYQNLQTSLFEFINNTKFTEINFRQAEKIECSILVDMLTREGNNFTAEINVALRRPVYKTNSTIGFYVYVMLGLDFDSFSPNGGDPFFAIAETIANAAPQNVDVGADNGWSSSGRQNRHAIISDINNATYQPLRQFLYDYHRTGLDVMAEHPDQGREAILGAISNLRAVYDRNPMCYFLQLIIESKRDEIIQVFSQGEMKIRTEAANILKAIDPSQSSRYDEMLQNKGF